MATTAEIKSLLLQAHADKSFRTKLVSNPGAAAGALGIKLSAGQINGFKGAKNAISLAGKSTDSRISQAAASVVALWI